MFPENLCKSKIKAGVFWKDWDVGRGEQGVSLSAGELFSYLQVCLSQMAARTKC